MTLLKANMFQVIVLILVCCFVPTTAQVTLNPDPEEDVQLQPPVLTPAIVVTTTQCYTSPPEIRVQYVTSSDYEVAYDILRGSGADPVSSSICGPSQSQYRVILDKLQFINDPVLVGGTFKLKITVNGDEGRSTYSRRTFTFPAPLNLTGSSGIAVLNTSFTWTCHVTQDYPILEWYRNSIKIVRMGVISGNCLTENPAVSYTYNCQQSSLTYTLTKPGPGMTEREQGSLWRCQGYNSELKGSKYERLDIDVPVTSVTISPGSGSIVQTDENQTITFNCTINNNPYPDPTIKWFIGSNEVTSQAENDPKTLEIAVNRNYHKMSVRCSAENSVNRSPVSDSTTMNIRYPPASNETLQITGYTNGQVLYENNSTMITIYCQQPGGNPVVNMTFTCGSKSGTKESTASEAKYRIDLVTNRNLNNQQCECVSAHINGYRRTTSVTFTVYYQPSTPTINLSRSFPWKLETSESLNCNTVPGNPAATTYKWIEGTNVIHTSQRYVINSLQGTDNGRQLSCQVNNDFTLHENAVMKSTATTLNVEYDPVVEIQQNNVEVVEGNTAVLSCIATGNPTPNVRWYRGTTAVTGSTVSSSAYTIINTSRIMTGNYTCKATASSTRTNTLKPDQKDLFLRVLYPPTVSLMIQNTTESTQNHAIRCTAYGEPNNSTFKLQQWIGSSFICNITQFMTSSPVEIVMNIDTVSYQDMGTYRCLATNGIPDRNNEVLQKDSGYFNVISSAKFQMNRYSFILKENKQASITVPFFSNPVAILSGVEWINKSKVISTNVEVNDQFSFSLNDIELTAKIHNVTVTLKGQRADWNVTSMKRFYSGKHMLKIKNSASLVAYTDVLLSVPEPPMIPLNVTVRCKGEAAYISWISNDNGGYDQVFQVMYKQEDETTFKIYQKEYIDAGLKTINYATINHIQPKTIYNFKVIAKNLHGLSVYTEIRNCVIFVDDGSDSGCNVAGVAGGITSAFVALLIIILTVIGIKQRKCTGNKGLRIKERKAAFDDPKDEQLRDGSENAETLGDRFTYEELQDLRDVHAYGGVGRRSETEEIPGGRSAYKELQNFRDVPVYDDVSRSQ